MKNLLLFLPLALLLSCKEQAKQQTPEQAWSKPITSFVDEEDVDTIMPVNPRNMSVDVPTEYETFLTEVYKDIFDGKLQAYDFKTGTPLSVDEVRKSLVTIDTMEVPFNKEKIFVSTDYEKQTTSTKVKEVWRYNKETKELKKKVTALAPRISVYSSSTGISKRVTPFWVFFDKQAEEEFKKSNRLKTETTK